MLNLSRQSALAVTVNLAEIFSISAITAGAWIIAEQGYAFVMSGRCEDNNPLNWSPDGVLEVFSSPFLASCVMRSSLLLSSRPLSLSHLSSLDAEAGMAYICSSDWAESHYYASPNNPSGLLGEIAFQSPSYAAFFRALGAFY